MTLRICAFVSGKGSNLEAIFRAQDAGLCASEVIAVVSDRPSAPALSLAAKRGIETHIVPFRRSDREDWDQQLARTFAATDAAWAVLMGFMRIIGPHTISATEGRIINVHPSLLPAFPGLNAPEQAIRAGVRISGCTVHLVDMGVDTGPILAQRPVPVFEDDTPQILHARIQLAEHRLLPYVVNAVAHGDVDARAKWRDGGRSASIEAPSV